jgi:hypothetical protein
VSEPPLLRTVVVQGPLAAGMRRFAAARAGEIGAQILSFSQLAARLAGGFTQPITSEILEPAIQEALKEKGFRDISRVCDLPGMTRAVARSLRKAWEADIDLAAREKSRTARLQDLAEIERRVRAKLPPAVLLPVDLREAALARIDRAPVLIGAVHIERVPWIPPLWRKLVNGLAEVVTVRWSAPAAADVSWFRGEVAMRAPERATAEQEVVSCADPRHEAVESLRWVRALLTSKAAAPRDIAIATAAPAAWDEYFLGLRANAGLRIYFTHGVPALSVREGQRCAAVADILLRGLSETRARRLVALCADQRTDLDRLPQGWLRALPRGAALMTLADWEHALRALKERDGFAEVESVLMPMLGVLARGAEAAPEAGALFLRGQSQAIWQTALRAAPPHAVELALQNIRLEDEGDPGDSVAWGPAAHLAAAPRAFVRLVGMTGGGWPRRGLEDALLPEHVVPALELDPDPVAEQDRRCFSVIAASASGQLVLSRSRRNAQGSRLGRSPLLPIDSAERNLARARIPAHAFSEADRLMARPAEARELDPVKSAMQCWRNWHVGNLTAHDGQFGAKHPGVRRALARTQSATSLQLLLRGPLGFVWKYALGWRAAIEQERPLTISHEAFGKLVHEVLRRAVDALEPSPGLALATREEIERTVNAAAEHVRQQWPLTQPVPPRLLWQNTTALAARIGVTALEFGRTTESDTQSWTEVPFGDRNFRDSARSLPWDPTQAVEIPGTGICIQGSIDRLDLRRTKGAVRVTDYKTGATPARAEKIVIRGGAELQRSLYALACRTLLPEYAHIAARLLYLADSPQPLPLADLDGALRQISDFVACACASLENGVAPPGPDADSPYNDLRLAMPASPAYQRRKRSSFAKSAGRLAAFWNMP